VRGQFKEVEKMTRVGWHVNLAVVHGCGRIGLIKLLGHV
jgi:hypothetical protein